MKVKVKCDHKVFNKVNLGIQWRCSTAPWTFYIFICFRNILKKLRLLFFPKIEPKHDISEFLNKPLSQF